MNSIAAHDIAAHNAAPKTAPGWRAELQLKFAVRGDRTYLASRHHVGPLLVQRPFHPEGGPCHAYIVHPPGGVVSGDDLHLGVAVTEGSHALLTTPAATKFYRSDGRVARQSQLFNVTGATLEWLPQETILFPGARVCSKTCIQLDSHSRFIGWELPCFGLPARNESFEAGELQFNLELWRDSTPLLVDRLRLRGESRARQASWGLAGHEAVGTLIAYPAARDELEVVRTLVADSQQAAVTLVDGVLVCRAVGAQAAPIRELFTRIWQVLRPRLLGREAVLPRIWAT